MASSTIGAIALYAPSPSGTSSTNPYASCASHATNGIPSSTTCTDACAPCTSHAPHGVLSGAPGTYAGAPSPVAPPVEPPPFFGQAYPPGVWEPISNYAPAPAQPY